MDETYDYIKFKQATKMSFFSQTEALNEHLAREVCNSKN